MKHQIVDLVASGATQQWSFTGEPSAWEACLRGSGDASYIHDDTLGHVSQLVTAQGTVPVFGFVSGIVVHFRYMATSFAGAPTIMAGLIHDGTTESGYIYPIGDTIWHDAQLKLFAAGGPTRFGTADLADLAVEFIVHVAPGPGEEIRISEAWLDVELCDSPTYYDPVTTVTTPDALMGYLAWNTAGGEAQSIPTDVLVFEDTSGIDFRRYWRTMEAYRYPTATEVVTDVFVADYGVTPAATCVARLAQVDDGTRSCWLTIVQSAGSWYLGLVSGAVDVNDIAQYRATSLLTAEEAATANYYEMLVDRNEDPGTPGLVTVTMNHVVRLTAFYRAFEPSPLQQLGFGTGGPGDMLAQDLEVHLNFWSWRHYQVAGPKFAAWEQDVGTTNTVVQNSTDYAIAKPVAVPGPYLGMQVGQSNYCCELTVQDPTALCSVYQLWRFPNAVTAYNLFVDYRVTVFGQTAEVLVQRTSDFYYWDQAIQNWVVGEISSTLPAAMTRQYRYSAMTNILSGVNPDGLLVRVRCIGGAPAHSVMIYKVLLQVA